MSVAFLECQIQSAKPQAASIRRLRLGACWFTARLLLFVAVAGLLILAHGCHGDEDNELFTSAIVTSGGTK